MIFRDRIDAGRQLALLLGSYANREDVEDVVVLGIPHDGVTVAFEVAQALRAPLDIFLSRKLGVPGHQELAFGAIAAGDGRYLDKRVIEATGISAQQIERVTQDVKNTLQERALLYRGSCPPLEVTDVNHLWPGPVVAWIEQRSRRYCDPRHSIGVGLLLRCLSCKLLARSSP